MIRLLLNILLLNIQITLIILKIVGAVDWSWIKVLLPTIILISSPIVAGLLILLLFAIGWFEF